MKQLFLLLVCFANDKMWPVKIPHVALLASSSVVMRHYASGAMNSKRNVFSVGYLIWQPVYRAPRRGEETQRGRLLSLRHAWMLVVFLSIYFQTALFQKIYLSQHHGSKSGSKLNKLEETFGFKEQLVYTVTMSISHKGLLHASLQVPLG